MRLPDMNACTDRPENKICLYEVPAEASTSAAAPAPAPVKKWTTMNTNNNHRGRKQTSGSNVNLDSDIMVQKKMTRATEYIDISNIAEHAEFKVPSPEEEEEEKQPNLDMEAMIREYEALFEYARRLRDLLNIKFKRLDKKSLETNFQLVKHHEHRTQMMNERLREAAKGKNYDDQIIIDHKISESRNTGKKKRSRKARKNPTLPDWIKFFVRLKKDNSERRWKNFMDYRKMMKKKTKGEVSGVKMSEKYNKEYMDVWTVNVVVYVRRGSCVSDIIHPAFAKLGLEARFDVSYTVGGFYGDKRKGKGLLPGSPKQAEPVSFGDVVDGLYMRNIYEIFVNMDRGVALLDFPVLYGIEPPPENKREPRKKDGRKSGKAGGKKAKV